MLTLVIAALIILAAVSTGGLFHYRRKYRMSQASQDRLSAASKAAVAKIAELETQNASLTTQLAAAQASAGAPDSFLDAESALLEQAVTPPAAPPADAPAPTTDPNAATNTSAS